MQDVFFESSHDDAEHHEGRRMLVVYCMELVAMWGNHGFDAY